VARTIDRGENWQIKQVPGAEATDFRDVEAFDENTAIIFGIASPAKFYKTTDGGKNWKLVYFNDSNGVFFNSAHFRSSKEAIALGDAMDGKFLIVKTNDGGDNWTELETNSRPDVIKGEGIFSASGSNTAMPDENKIMFVTGCTAARVFLSNDNAKSWTFVETPMESGTGTNGIFSIAMKNSKEGIIVGGDYEKEDQANTTAALTNDGGKNWTLIEKNKPAGFRECVKYIPGTNTVITVGPNGSDISYDNGKNFRNFASYMGLHTLAVSPDGKACWAAGRNGRIAKLFWKDR
jgi:photosystem II stability/assembly factor-like uncharacterized protein